MFSNTIRKNNILFSLLSIAFVLLSAAIIKGLSGYFVNNESAKVERVMTKNLALVRSKFEATLFMDTYLADSLATVVTIDPKFAIDNWDAIAGKLMQKARFVRNVAIAPNNVIKKVYPLKGNEGALGFDFRTQPTQLRTVLRAKETQQVTIDGPLNLIQGGRGLIARYPIFSDYPQNQDYWGTVSVVMDYEKLLDDIGIKNFSGAQIALRQPSASDSAGLVFYGDKQTFERPDVEHSVMLPNGHWEMAAKLNLDDVEHIQDARNFVNIIGYSAAFLLYTIIFLHYRSYCRVHKASLHDELTRLPNRRFMLSLLNKQIKPSETPQSFALLNIDLNDFKRVNDELGHEAGDELLKHVAVELKDCIRTSDTVARFGGDEFIVLLQNVSTKENVDVVINKIRQALENEPLHWRDVTIQPSLSIGYTFYNGQNTNIKQLLSEADKAMYQQKARYKSQKTTA